MKNIKYLLSVSIILLTVLMISGCGPALAKSGDTVKVHYTGTLADGTEFDSSIGSEPLEFVIGEGNIIDGFEQAVIGMKAGETKTFTLTPDQAYGQRDEKLEFEVGRDELPPSIIPEPGMQLQASQGIITIIEVTETTVKLDANHPLAGKDLTFNIELMEIGKSKSQGESLTSTDLAAALASGKPTLAEFGSTTCVPCKQMKPILEELASTYKDIVHIVIIEIYDNRDLANKYKIMAMPTQVFFDSKGQEVTRHVGFWAKEEILTQIKKMGIE